MESPLPTKIGIEERNLRGRYIEFLVPDFTYEEMKSYWYMLINPHKKLKKANWETQN